MSYFVSQIGSAFVSGFDDWQHLNPRLLDHEINILRKKNCIKWKELEKRLLDDKTIDCEVQKMFKSEKEKRRNILKIIVEIIMFCSRNNLALRVHSENITNSKKGIFLDLIELISHYNPILEEHLKFIKEEKSKISYFSPTIQNDFIFLMGKSVKTKILENIKKSKYYAILFDSTPDFSHKEQLSQIIRYVKISNDEVIDFIETKEKTGTGLASDIVDKLKIYGLDINNCRGQGFDNGANMANIYPRLYRNSSVHHNIFQHIFNNSN